jgi:signal transduction histidine kinase
MTGLRWRFFWTMALVSLCLVTLCVFTAVSLFHQQATIAGVLRENVASRRAAADLRGVLNTLIELETHHVESVADLHAQAATHLGEIRRFADQAQEQELSAHLDVEFAAYLRRWQSLPPATDPRHDTAVTEATRYLEVNVLHLCREIEGYNDRRIEEATTHHEQVLRRLAWGMAGIGGLGGFAGLVLGYGVARGLSRSIHRLQVRIRDVAGKLAHATLPEIVFIGDSGFEGLHRQIDRLTSRIEQVVQQLQQREYEVLRAEQLAAVGQLAAGVGHEIRNPLTSIKMLVQAELEEGARGGLTSEDLQVIEAEVRRMERSIQTFLDFARPPKPERRPVDLTVVIDTVLGLTRGRVERQRVACQVDAPPGRVAVIGDAGQIQQVLVNLVLNALDAMPGGGTLTVAVRRAGDRVEVVVADTGSGVPPDVIPRLFHPFVSSKDTGLGLGLVISRRIAEDHGGTITVSNRPGGGASAVVTLPTGSLTNGR